MKICYSTRQQLADIRTCITTLQLYIIKCASHTFWNTHYHKWIVYMVGSGNCYSHWHEWPCVIDCWWVPQHLHTGRGQGVFERLLNYNAIDKRNFEGLEGNAKQDHALSCTSLSQACFQPAWPTRPCQQHSPMYLSAKELTMPWQNK